MNPLIAKAAWLQDEDIRPFVFVRPENQISNPGSRHHLDWFPHEPIFKNPMQLEEIAFADVIYSIESRAFGPANMAMPRWVFYDCAVIPGFVGGFCIRPHRLPKKVREVLDNQVFPALGSPTLKEGSLAKKYIQSIDQMDWVPLSLFIIIPTMHRGEWVAHNLCSVNSLLPKEEQYYGLGFLSKAFSLWYANVEQCSGMTQWSSPALKLHSHYGHMEVIGAYTPVHSHANTLTYRVQVNTHVWEKFFNRSEDYSFLENYAKSQHLIDPKSEQSMIDLQTRIENNEGPFYLSATEIAQKNIQDALHLYIKKEGF